MNGLSSHLNGGSVVAAKYRKQENKKSGYCHQVYHSIDFPYTVRFLLRTGVLVKKAVLEPSKALNLRTCTTGAFAVSFRALN